MKRLEKKWTSLLKKLSLILFSFLTLLIFSSQSISSEKTISGKAKVVDGDTIKISKIKIRLFGVDAPEKKQICKKTYMIFFIFNFQKDYKCGEKSTLALTEKIKNKKVKCIIKEKKDRYKRSIGICYIDNQDINKWLVKNGHALAYKRYSKKYVIDELYAKENKLGIWGGTFVRPEKWRRIMN